MISQKEFDRQINVVVGHLATAQQHVGRALSDFTAREMEKMNTESPGSGEAHQAAILDQGEEGLDHARKKLDLLIQYMQDTR